MFMNKMQILNPTVYIPSKLKKRLETIHSYPLIVLQAASGFGKTTVISEYLRKADVHQSYWYTCMGETLSKSWNGICKTFSHIDNSAAEQLKTLEYPTQENLVDIAEIMSECDVDWDTWFIIDNFQYIQDELPERILYALSCHGCSRLHIIIITQFIDSMDINGLPAEQAVIIKNDAFFFQKEDTDAYFRANKIALSLRELNRLQRLSEGWVAALNLQLIRYKREGDFKVTDSMDNLIRAVIWNHLEPEEKRFLAAVSLLKHFSVEQAYILLGKNTLLAGIARLLDDGSFIRYESDSGTYSLHSLLQNFLKHELKCLPAGELRMMQKLAADAYAAVGENYYALQNYLEAGEWECLLSLPLKAADFSLYLKDGSTEILERVLIECDKRILVSYPQTLSIITFELFRAGSYTEFQKGCILMEEMASCPEQHGFSNEDVRILNGQLALLQSFTAFNDIEKMSALHHRAWDALGGPFSNRADWNDSWAFGQPSVMYLFWSESGALDRELDCMDECLPYYIRLTEGHGSGANCAMRAEALLMRGDDAAAEALCHKAIYLASTQEQDSICFAAEMTLLRIALLRGDSQDFENVKNSILKRAKAVSKPSEKIVAELALSFVLGLTENYVAPEWLMNYERIKEILYDAAIPFGVLTYLSLLLPTGQDAKLLGTAQGVLPAAEQHHFLLPQVYFHLFIAVAHHRLGQNKEAEAALDRALSIALPDGIYLPFAEYGDELAPLLKLKGRQIDMVEILTLCRVQRQGVEKILKAITNNQLSPREREVAHLAAEGLTNRDIASRLLISQETVKTTMKSIFQKMGTRSRVQLQDLKDAGKF